MIWCLSCLQFEEGIGSKSWGSRCEIEKKKKNFGFRKNGEKQENDDIDVQIKLLGAQLFFTLWTEHWVNFPDSIITLMYD